MAEWTGTQMRGALPGNPVDSPRGRLLYATGGRDVLLNSPDGWLTDAPGLWFTDPDGTIGNPPPGTDDPYGYTALPAVARCTSLITETIAGLPWQVFRDQYEQLDAPSWITDPQGLRLDGRVIDPATVDDVRLSAVEFYTQWVTAALWFGDGFIYAPSRDDAGAPRPPLWGLHPHKVRIEADTYWVEDIPLPSGSVIHLRGRPPYWNGRGHGVISDHGAALGLAATVASYALGVFSSGVPAGYLKSTQPSMSADQAAALKAAWLAQHGNSKRSIAVLNATTDFHAIAISPIDAQLEAAKKASLTDVALAFGVPPYMIGAPSGDSNTYANVESRMIEFRTFTLLPWQRRIESTLDAQLPRGTELKVRSDALLRADTATRYAAHKTALDAGFLTIDEVRQLEDRPPLQTEGVL